MKHRVAKQALKERDRLREQLAEAARRQADADRETDRLLAAAHEVDIEHIKADMDKTAFDERIAELERARTQAIHRRAFWAAEQRDAHTRANLAARESNERRRDAEALARRLEDPRFARAEERLAQARPPEASAPAPGQAPPLSPEAAAGLSLLRRAFDPSGIKRPERLAVSHDTGAVRDLDEEELLRPCDECGAAVGVDCDEAKHERLEVERRRGK